MNKDIITNEINIVYFDPILITGNDETKRFKFNSDGIQIKFNNEYYQLKEENFSIIIYFSNKIANKEKTVKFYNITNGELLIIKVIDLMTVKTIDNIDAVQLLLRQDTFNPLNYNLLFEELYELNKERYLDYCLSENKSDLFYQTLKLKIG